MSRSETTNVLVIIIGFCLGLFLVIPSKAQIREHTATELKGQAGTNPDYYQAPVYEPLLIPDTLELLPWIKQDFLVNELAGDYGCEQWYPNIASDSSGNYAVAWNDQRNGRADIYVQFFNNRDERIGANILANEQVCSNIYFTPFIAANKRGDFIVAWSEGAYDVVVQKFTNGGIKMGGNLTLDVLTLWNQDEVSLVLAENGCFLVSWVDRYSKGNIYSRLFNPDGLALSQAMVLNDKMDEPTIYTNYHCSAVDAQNNFVVVWRRRTQSISRILLQRLDSNGIKTGRNITVSDSMDTRNHYDPAITAADDGDFFIVWNSDDYQNENGGTTARIYHSSEQILSEQITISVGNSYLYSNMLAGNRKDTFWIFVFNQENGTVRCQKISRTGELQGPTIIHQLDLADSLYIHDIAIADIFTGQFFITFLRYYRGDTEVFAQRFDQNLQPLSMPVKGNMDQFSAWQNNPSVCFNRQGGSMVLWEDHRNGRYDLYSQVYDPDFNPVGDNMQINDLPVRYSYYGDKQADALSDGTFIIAFCGAEDAYDGDIYLQAVNPQGYKIGTNVLVKANNATYKVELNINAQDQILLCWYNENLGYLRKYDQNLTAVSTEKVMYKYDQNRLYQPVALFINEDLNIFISWIYRYRQNYDNDTILYGLLLDQTGTVIGDTIIINEWEYSPYLYSLENYLTTSGDYIVGWYSGSRIFIWRKFTTGQSYTFMNYWYNWDYRNSQLEIVQSKNYKTFMTYNSGSEILGWYFNDNKHQSQLYRLYRYKSTTHLDDQYYNAGVLNDNLFFTYESNIHGESGIDIWGNVQSLADIDFGPEVFRQPLTDDILYPNFPNPFNGITRIAYELLAFHKVKLAIYDVLGREVRVLVDKNQERGYYEVELDAAGLASGIYFVKLEAFRTQVRKIILIK